jgi:hypothetical protein
MLIRYFNGLDAAMDLVLENKLSTSDFVAFCQKRVMLLHHQFPVLLNLDVWPKNEHLESNKGGLFILNLEL